MPTTNIDQRRRLRYRTLGPDRVSARLGLLIVLGLLAVSLGTYFLLGPRVAGYSEPADLADLAWQEEVPSARELYPLALAEAREWDAVAYLVDVGFFLRPVDLYSFGFATRLDPRKGLLVYVEPSDDGVTIRSEETYSRDRTYAEFEPWIGDADWRVDSPDAFKIALLNGGEAFLREYPSAGLWWMQLWYFRGKLQWRVVFSNEDPRFGPHFGILIDPKTGEVLDVKLQAE